MTPAANASADSRKEAFAPLPLPPLGATASGQAWRLRAVNDRETLAIAQKAGVDPTLAQILAARGVTHENAEAYLAPSLKTSMPDPFVLKDMDIAAERISRAIIESEQVGVFGDYDVDGTTATAMFKLYFNAIDASLLTYLPDRIAEGYGPSIDAFNALQTQGAQLVMTVDCGAAAHAPVEQATREGLDIVILDHHLMDGPPPAGAIATVNPNRADDISGLANLSAAGLAFMTLVAVNRALREKGFFNDRKEPDLLSLLDLTALGLVCDVMPITGLTRTLVAQGLKVLGAGGNQGLYALGERAGLKGPPTAYHLGFLLGPRINAAGRIGHARLALELLTTNDPARRLELAEKLHMLNAQRQDIEERAQNDALRDIQMHQRHADSVIVTAGKGWHPGVIGIVAGRLKERFNKPVIVVSLDGDLGKGSGRSISGVDLGAAVSDMRKEGLLVAGGGHAMAAGLTIETNNLGVFRRRLNERLSQGVEAARAGRRLDIDAVVAPLAVTKSFAELIANAGPFGPGNPEPVFAIADLRAEHVKIVGKGHVSITLTGETGEKTRAIAFRAADEPLGELLSSGRRLHIAGKIRADDWRGGDAGQLHILDAALTA